MGRWLILAGAMLVVAGVAITYAPWLLSWFGRLPGDIRIEGERSKVFAPIASMIVVSLVLSALLNVLLMLRR